MKKTILAFLILMTIAVGCKGEAGSNTLVFGRGGDSVTMDPAHATDGETFYATTQVYDNLVQFKYGTTEIEPALAERWEISDNGLEYTFYLRKGVKFHQTKFFTEEAAFTTA